MDKLSKKYRSSNKRDNRLGKWFSVTKIMVFFPNDFPHSGDDRKGSTGSNLQGSGPRL